MMPGTNSPAGGTYLLQFHVASALRVNSPNPGGWYLTSNGEGKQLTIEMFNDQSNQKWNIQPITGENPDSPYRTIVPTLSPDIPAVSQDVVEYPNKVSLIKNLQVWSFIQHNNDLYEIRSNLYPGVDRINYLMSVELTDPIEDNQIIILDIPANPPPHTTDTPVWKLIPVNSKK